MHDTGDKGRKDDDRAQDVTHPSEFSVNTENAMKKNEDCKLGQRYSRDVYNEVGAKKLGNMSEMHI